jgi:two-component system NtrC family response regulator
LGKILLVDDDQMLCKALCAEIVRMGHECSEVYSLSDAFEKLSGGDVDVVILDIALPDGDGLQELSRIRSSKSKPEVIILTAEPDPESAELAIHGGAWSYFSKPPATDRIGTVLQRAVSYKSRKSKKPVALKRCGIIGESEMLLSCLNNVARAASTDASALITGETGTGKELFAAAIHRNSARSKRPFVVVDCAAMPETLVENMLFGHEKGAFTSADQRSVGLVRQAHTGTLFLDEVGEMPLHVQKSFLRVLEGRSFRPVGGTKEQTSDFRLVAATNRDLEAMVESEKFRPDLLHRLRGIHIELPPLRNCVSDINDMTCKFLGRICAKRGIPRKGFSQDFLEALENYHWPGNVRELINTLQYAVSNAGEAEALFPRHLPTYIRADLARKSMEKRSDEPGRKSAETPKTTLDKNLFPKLRDFRERAMEELETQYMRDLMHVTDGEIAAACKLSGLSRARVYALLKKYGISR